MKNFLKTTLAVVCGVLLCWFLAFSLFFGIVGTLAGSSSKPSIPSSGVLKIDLSEFSLAEQSRSQTPFQSLPQGTVIGIRAACEALRKAAADPAVKFVYLRADGSTAEGSLSSMQEFRRALSDFRQSGKAVVSYIEFPTTATYYLSSVADKIYMTEYCGAAMMLNGVSTQTVFLGDLLDKLGVNVQIIRHGKYKSAGEMFTRNRSSAENLEQTREMVLSLWKGISEDIRRSRGIGAEQLDRAIENLELVTPGDFLEKSLVDELMGRQALQDKLASLYGAPSFNQVRMISFPDYVSAKVVPNFRAKKKIAVVYLNGEIMDGKAKFQVSGDRFAGILERIKADSTVKAVVLRVNSPGGSPLAADKIRTGVEALRTVKPVAASYGDYAASGGYWLSNSCDHIFALPSTITGSIGVFGIIPDFSKTAREKLHINVESVSSHRHGDMYSMTRPLDEAEIRFQQRSIEAVYARFVQTVAEGRGMAVEEVEKVAEGRIWTGISAVEHNLADELGTLEDAIAWAAAEAGDPDLRDWLVAEYPAPASALEGVLSFFSGSGGDGGYLGSLRECRKPATIARLPFEFKIK